MSPLLKEHGDLWRAAAVLRLTARAIRRDKHLSHQGETASDVILAVSVAQALIVPALEALEQMGKGGTAWGIKHSARDWFSVGAHHD
jgi:hypothetical protein